MEIVSEIKNNSKKIKEIKSKIVYFEKKYNCTLSKFGLNLFTNRVKSCADIGKIYSDYIEWSKYEQILTKSKETEKLV